MALSERSRSALFTGLTPIIGEEATAEMLGQFPARDVEEMVAREHLDRRFAEFGAELKGEMADLRAELKGEMTDLRAELKGEMAELGGRLDGEMAELSGGLRAEMHQLGVRLYMSLTATLFAFLALAVTVLSLTN